MPLELGQVLHLSGATTCRACDSVQTRPSPDRIVGTMPPLPSLALEARSQFMNPAPLAGRRRPASLAPIYAALAVLVGLGLLALFVASWPPGTTRPPDFQHPRFRAPAEHPAGNGVEAPSRPAAPKRGGMWTQASLAQGFVPRG
jgi:hypothetical protein